MTLWWLKDFARVRSEMAAVEQAAAEGWFRLSGWRVNRFRFSADGVITAHGVEYPVCLIYPDQFPLVPAWVEPHDPEAQWSSHQYGKGGALCLELRPDNWSPYASGADVVRSAYNLLLTENPLGAGEHGTVPSAHQVGSVQSSLWGITSVLISAGCLARLQAGTAEGIRAFRWMLHDGMWPILVFDATDRRHPRHIASSPPGAFGHELPIVIAHSSLPDPLHRDRAALASALGINLDNHTDALMVIAIDGDRIIPIHSMGTDFTLKCEWFVLPDDAGTRTGRAIPEVPKSVALIGLGSVGSKIAEILLRSGISYFVLVDGDVLLPANLERHTLDWRDVGFRKANGVKRRLHHIMPGAQIEVIAENLNWQRSARAHANQLDVIANCDLLVDATGDAPTTLLLGAIASESNKPFVSVEVFEGGLGCLVARSLPERDPAYVHGRAAYIAYCEQQNVEPPLSSHRAYEALSASGEPLVADDAAVTIAAAHAARVILDILDERVSASDAAWLLFGFREGWLFRRHGDSLSLDMGSVSPPDPAVEDNEIRDFVMALAKKALNETPPTT
ncbi:ThiF family adenylyltransferase [Leptolyngbya sp. PL-A3]|uniref:ThiF family adenylyltransferase n=1 Tax=Leptolyngbya sp. PL-A3 TaxID=2933911 RepID=UPI003297C87A